MTSSRSYLLRAMYEWLLDNDCTPHIVVNAIMQDVDVPQSYVEQGQIVLNITPKAVNDLELGNEFVSFNAKFRNIQTDIMVPVASVMGIYAKENGRGMMFDNPDDSPPESPTPVGSPRLISPSTKKKSAPRKPTKQPTLKIIK